MFSGLQNGSGPISHGAYTVTSVDAIANTTAIDTGLTIIEVAIVQAIRSGAVVTSGAAVSCNGGVLTVASGTTYVMAAGDVLNWVAIGM